MAAVAAYDMHPDKASINTSTIDPLTLSMDHLKRLLEDDTYLVLKKRLLFQGRGGPQNSETLPSDPSQVVTNRLLLQLYCLKQGDEQLTYSDLQEWLCKLDPTLAHVTRARISHHLTSVLKACLEMTEEAAMAFLDEKFNFHALRKALSDVGLDRLHLLDVNPFIPSESTVVSNAIVRALEHFQVKEALPVSFVIKWLKKLDPSIELSDAKLRYRILSVSKKIRTLAKNKNNLELDELLALPFLLQPSAVVPSGTKLVTKSTSGCEEQCRELRKTNAVLEEKVSGQDLQISILKAELQSLTKANENLKLELHEMRKKWKLAGKGNSTLKRKFEDEKEKAAVESSM